MSVKPFQCVCTYIDRMLILTYAITVHNIYDTCTK